MTTHAQDLQAFANELRRLAGQVEPSLYSAFKALVEAAYGPAYVVDSQIPAPGSGFPDLTVAHGLRLTNWIEVKRPEVHIDPLPAVDQVRFDRYREALPHIVLTNGWQWILFIDGDEVSRAEVPKAWIVGNQALTNQQVDELAQFLDGLQALPPTTAPTYDHAVDLLATAAKLIFHAVDDTDEADLPGALKQARNAMADLLRTNPADPAEISTEDFADTLAQICVFGYVLARVESGTDVTPDSAPSALSTTEHPFLKSTIYAMVAPDPDLEALLGGILRTAADAVNAAAPKLAGPHGNWDRVPYVYEEFFARYRPADRFKFGVFYTPPEVTRFQVRRVQETLRTKFGLTGLTDPQVRFLEPACGTGTYLLALAEEAELEAIASGDPVAATLRELFTSRVVGFEVAPGPAVVAQARLNAWLKSKGVALGIRFPIYTVNSLTPPKAGGMGHSGGTTANLWLDNINDEQDAGDNIKRNTPILVVIGNPPWGDRPRETFQVGESDDDNLIAGWATGVDAAVINLYDLYVAFWRLACNFLLDRPTTQAPEGIISYITNRSWVYGRAYSGMRKWLRQHNVIADIIDLGGDNRAGAKADDAPVFSIRTGSAIATLAFRSGHASAVDYGRIRGSRQDKLTLLENDTVPARLSVNGTDGKWFGPVDWSPIDEAKSVKELMHARYPGVKTHRDDLIIDVDKGELIRRLEAWNVMPDDARAEMFDSSDDPREPPSINYTVDESLAVRHRYRPLDDRWLYSDRAFIDRPGRVSRVFKARPDTECLLTLDSRTTDGPAVIATCTLPGYNSFRGSYETHAYVLQASAQPFSLEATDAIHLIEDDLLPPAVRAWAKNFAASPRDAGAYILALGNAPSYSVTFAEALEVETARFPATSDSSLFWEAATIGKALLDAWCFRAAPAGTWHQVSNVEALGEYEIVAGNLEFSNGDRLTGLHPGIDDLLVSRWPVFQRFLEARSHLSLSVELASEIRKVAGSIAVILDSRPSCDDILKRVVSGPQHVFP